MQKKDPTSSHKEINESKGIALVLLLAIFSKQKKKNLQQNKEIEKNSNNISTAVFQLDFEIFRTIASFIKISSGHSLKIKLIFIKFFRTS